MINQVPTENPSIRAHKRQFGWQILAPFLLMTGVIITGAVLIVTGETSQTIVWTDISMIWLIAPLLVLALVFLAVVVSSIYGMLRLLQVLPEYTGKAQDIFKVLSSGTRKVADGAVKPLLWVHQIGAVFRSIFRL
jgi:hypothetical protein